MSVETKLLALFGILLIVVTCCFIIGYAHDIRSIKSSYENKIEKLQKSINETRYDERCKMRYRQNHTYYRSSNVNGLYYIGEDYYVVWMKNRTLEEQERTDRHEYCHYLIDNDRVHFCE